jgi:hypothetical protein
MNDLIKILNEAIMDIDLATPGNMISGKEDGYPWNKVENMTEHKCAVKNVSICRYFAALNTCTRFYSVIRTPTLSKVKSCEITMKHLRVGLMLVPVLFLLMVAVGCAPGVASPQTGSSCPAGTDCSSLSLTLTVAAYTSAPGDLGWGEVRGRVIDTINGSPIEGATITCAHRSNHPVRLCSGSVMTAKDGSFVFPHIFFQDKDVIELSISHPLYGGNAIRQEFFTQPSLYVNFSLPVIDLTSHPCCTAPACGENEVLSCPGVCTCGCGTTCVTKTPTPLGFPTQTPLISPTPYISPTP